MNERALSDFNQTAKTIQKEEQKLARARNLRDVTAKRFEDRRKKIAADYDKRKANAIGKVAGDKAAALRATDDEITALAANIELQKKRLSELAREVPTNPAPNETVVVSPRFTGTVGASNGVAVH